MAIDTEVEVLKSVVQKLDVSLDKISQVSNDIGRLLAVHDERINQLERTADRRSDDVKELHSRITTQTREIMEKLEELESGLDKKMKDNAENSAKQHKEIQDGIRVDLKDIDSRIATLERWRWYIIGAAATIGYLIGNITDIVKILGK